MKRDAKAHANRYIESLRTWGNSTYRAGLHSSRSEEEKDQIVDELYRRYEADVAAAPEDHGADYVHAYMWIEKTSEKMNSEVRALREG